MKKLAALLSLLTLAVSAAAVAGPTGGGFTVGKVEYVKTFPFDTTAMSARKVGDHFFVLSMKTFSIYDVSKPLDPSLVSTTPLGFDFPAEDVDTNGKILLVSEQVPRGILHVWDVRDKAMPVKLAELAGAGDHTMTCVLDCKWGYGANGTIVDLRKPGKPRIAGNWARKNSYRYGHEVNEVAPGIVATATTPQMYLLDARKNPKKPRRLAVGDTSFLDPAEDRIVQSIDWPRRMRDEFLLVAGESPFTGPCTEKSAPFMTWDASRWRKTRTFKLIDSYQLENGTYTDGNPAHNTVGCSASYADPHRSFRDGGLVVSAFWDHGTRFLRVDRKGRIHEAAVYLPYGGITAASYWMTKRIVYAVDLTRGIDILRYTGRI
jgi:hypothetical protein